MVWRIVQDTPTHRHGIFQEEVQYEKERKSPYRIK